MNIKLWFTFFIGFTCAICVGQNPNPNPALNVIILDEMVNERLPGVSTLIVKDGEIVWIESFGNANLAQADLVDDSTIFLLASISKVFTATAAFQLMEDGQLNLDRDINQYLPFSVEVPGYESDSITMRHLLTHTSGIEDNGPVQDTYYSTGDPTISLADVCQRYFATNGSDYDASGNFFNRAPGTGYDYSNMAIALAGFVLESLSGIDFNQYCKQTIFNPLCMNNTSWYLSGLDVAKSRLIVRELWQIKIVLDRKSVV